MVADQTLEDICLEFGPLPLVEVQIRLSYVKEINLTFEQISAIKSLLPHSFVGPSELTDFEAPPGIPNFVLPVPPTLAGAVYTDPSRNLRVLIEPQLLSVRWVHSTTPPAPPYPRYAALRSVLEDLLAEPNAMVPTWKQPVVVNMVYVNMVPNDQFDSPSKFLSPEVFPSRFADNPKQYAYLISSQSEDRTDLTIDVKSVTWKDSGGSQTGFRFATAGGVRLADTDEALSTANRIHKRLQYFFKSILSDRAKQTWELHNP